MKQQVNVIAVVDVIGALSDSSLGNGNLVMVDDGSLSSTGQGTPDLVTVVTPGQVVQWTVLALDLQTPVEIRSITFLGPDSGGGAGTDFGTGQSTDHSTDRGADSGAAREQLGLDVWSGVVPEYMTPGVPHRYRLEFRMYEGDHSLLHVDSPALMRL